MPRAGGCVMAIAKEDIKEGHYWVRSRKNSELSIVLVATYEIEIDNPETRVMHHGWEVPNTIDDAVEEFDFLMRIEPPEGV
jgi:hypothetical protein